MVFQITEKDVLSMLDSLGDGYPIARALEHGDVEDACMYVRTRLEEIVAAELEDALVIFLEELEVQKRKDNRRLW